MTNFEMVELLRQKANVSYEEAKAALEAANWDLLDAIVLLEKEGRVADGGAAYSTGTKREEKSEKKKQSRGLKKRVGNPVASVDCGRPAAVSAGMADAHPGGGRPVLRRALFAARSASRQ